MADFAVDMSAEVKASAVMEDKRLPQPTPTDSSREFAEETRSLDSFEVPTPGVSEPATPVAAMADAVDPFDFDD